LHIKEARDVYKEVGVLWRPRFISHAAKPITLEDCVD